MKKIGIVLEGGGFRGVYSSGILDYFLEQEWHFPYVIGVSMGAVNGANYISKQKRRSIDVPYAFLHDQRYFSYRNLLTKGSLFGMDFIFHEIPNKHNLFDFDTFRNSNQEFVVTTMDVHFGGSKYFTKSELSDKDFLVALQASCSLPFISKMVTVKGKKYLDGGLSDSIPVQKAFEDGVDKVIVLVTREKGYRKEVKKRKNGQFFYRGYPEVVSAINQRSSKYNEELDYMEKMASTGAVLPIYPNEAINIGRTERNEEKLMKAYNDGYQRGIECHDMILEFMNS
jgi:predicted patatin/cPLA2 family phospholipase